jgi:hypothetical protein
MQFKELVRELRVTVESEKVSDDNASTLLFEISQNSNRDDLSGQVSNSN